MIESISTSPSFPPPSLDLPRHKHLGDSISDHSLFAHLAVTMALFLPSLGLAMVVTDLGLLFSLLGGRRHFIELLVSFHFDL